jgi:hypothetical protein
MVNFAWLYKSMLDLDLDFGIVYSQSLKFNLKLQRIYKIIIQSLIRIIIIKIRLWLWLW